MKDQSEMMDASATHAHETAAVRADGTRPVPSRVLDTLRCPKCHASLKESKSSFVCTSGHEWSWRAGYLDLSVEVDGDDARRLLDSFGEEWEAFPDIQPEDEPFWNRYAADLDTSEVRDLGIDVGCGKGRFSWFLAPAVRHLVAFDGSLSAGVAARNLRQRDNVLPMRADLHQAPFADGSFDLVTCIGVLHYVPDPAAGFRHVARLLAPGGTLLLSVYSRPEAVGVRKAALDAAAALRRLTPRIPHAWLRPACAPLALGLYGAVVLPGQLGAALGIAPLAKLPLQTYRERPLRSLWLDTFNRLAAPFEHRFSRDDIDTWLRDAGLILEHIRQDAGWMVVARRPTSAS